jgi:hypothetical protein
MTAFSAPRELSDDAITRLQSGDAFAHVFNDSCDLPARREGALGSLLIFILDNEKVRIVDAARFHGHQYLASIPPSATMSMPMMYELSSDATNHRFIPSCGSNSRCGIWSPQLLLRHSGCPQIGWSRHVRIRVHDRYRVKDVV